MDSTLVKSYSRRETQRFFGRSVEVFHQPVIIKDHQLTGGEDRGQESNWQDRLQEIICLSSNSFCTGMRIRCAVMPVSDVCMRHF